jgi:catechol 2,3-dioxygenase-like lactoylglutathione lyase family enzyme
VIDHVSVAVCDLGRSASFYRLVLAPLGLAELVARERTVGFGKRYPEFWINLREKLPHVPASTGVHVCLRAPDENAVRTFHAVALGQGGGDAGEPGPRQAALTTYYGAFIFDPDGNKIEAVTFPRTESE